MKRLSDIERAEVNRFLDRLNSDESAVEHFQKFVAGLFVEAALDAEEKDDEDGVSLPVDFDDLAPLADSLNVAFAAGELHAKLGMTSDLAFQIAGLARRGLLGAIRACEGCKRWMFANSKKQRVCSAACRHKIWEQKPETKEHTNFYHRYYHAVNVSPKWREFDEKDKPTFEDWKKHNGLTVDDWKKILKRRRKK